MFNIIKKITDIDHIVYDFVEEGSKAGTAGTAFLHMCVVAGLFVFGGVFAQGIIWLTTLPFFTAAFATVVGLLGLYFYAKREFSLDEGDFWGYAEDRDGWGMFDSFLDFFAPLVALGVLLYFLWL